MVLRGVCLAAALLVLGGCLKPPPATTAEAVERERQYQLGLPQIGLSQAGPVTQDQVLAVTQRLTAASRQVCGGRAEQLYMLKIGPGHVIEAVPPDSSAERAGLRVGDVIETVSLPGGRMMGGDHIESTLLEAEERGLPVSLSVARNGVPMFVEMGPDILCSLRLVVAEALEPTAITDGETIVVTTGLIRFVRSEAELAAIIAHEMAHSILGHQTAAMAGQRQAELAAYIKRGPNATDFAFSRQLEADADYVGLYLAARAGYDLDDIPTIWRRLAQVDPSMITFGGDHPTTPERVVAMEQTIAEIRARQAAGQELVPYPR
jgi:hypothetical protein